MRPHAAAASRLAPDGAADDGRAAVAASPNGRDLQARARALDAEARHHKREERRHRNAARRAREDLAALERQCARLGIALTLQPAQETIHGQDPDPRPQHAD